MDGGSMFERACQKYVKRVMLLQFLALSLVHQLMRQNLLKKKTHEAKPKTSHTQNLLSSHQLLLVGIRIHYAPYINIAKDLSMALITW